MGVLMNETAKQTKIRNAHKFMTRKKKFNQIYKIKNNL